jgi:hypothetical protein
MKEEGRRRKDERGKRKEDGEYPPILVIDTVCTINGSMGCRP